MTNLFVKRVTTTHHNILKADGKPVVRLHEPPGRFLPLALCLANVRSLGYYATDYGAWSPWSGIFINPATNTTKQVEWFAAD